MSARCVFFQNTPSILPVLYPASVSFCCNSFTSSPLIRGLESLRVLEKDTSRVSFSDGRGFASSEMFRFAEKFFEEISSLGCSQKTFW